MFLVWTYNRQIRSEHMCFDLWPSSASGTSHGHRQQTFACMALVRRPLPQPAQEKAQPCGFWTGRQGRETQASFIQHSQPLRCPKLPVQNLQKKKKKRQRVGCGTWLCESAVQSGHRWEGVQTGFALVLANKHINSKVDNQVGGEGGQRGSLWC